MATDLLCAVTADDDGATNPEADGARRRRAAAADRSFIVDCWSFFGRSVGVINGMVPTSKLLSHGTTAHFPARFDTAKRRRQWRQYRRPHRRAIVAISTLKLVHMRTRFYLTYFRRHLIVSGRLAGTGRHSSIRTFGLVQRAKSEATNEQGGAFTVTRGHL